MNKQKKLLFFLSHQPNPRFVKQINFFANNDFDVSLFYFRRTTLADLDSSINHNVTTFYLGIIPNFSKPIKRILKYFSVFLMLKNKLKKESYDIVLLNNIDILTLYILSFKNNKNSKKTKIVMEISDLRSFVFGKAFLDRFVRFVERKIYVKYVDKLIVTSKRFYSYHFKNFFLKDFFVLENKILSSEILSQNKLNKKYSKKTIIGIVGLLLRKNEYIKLFETYKNSSLIEIHVYGTGQFQNLVEEYANKYENIVYHGKYNTFKDSRKIYNSIDFVYLVYEATNKNINNILALPNKLYESIFYKTPILCSKGTYLEEIVLKNKIGVSINYIRDKEIERGVGYLIENKESILENFRKIPKNMYLADDDYKKLKNFLLK